MRSNHRRPSAGWLRGHLRNNVVGYIALAVAVAGSSAYAAGAIPGKDGKITACYSTKSGVLQVVDAAKKKKCGKGKKKVAWSQKGPQGLRGEKGAQGLRGQKGAQGPSDIYVAGATGVALDTTGGRTEVASITVPAGSYLLGATLWLAKGASGTSQVTCQLESNATFPRTYYGASRAPLLTDASDRANLSLTGADTFTADQVVKLFCGADNTATGADDVRLWAIKTGNLHAILPLPSD
jgi:hypothetical protein